MSKRSLADANSGNPSHIRLETVNTLWLEASATERYLLLEDPETKDVLMPLIYMKHVLEANYSRKLASLKHRLVTAPPTGPMANHAGLLYWQWAFESPHAIKLIVRNEIGDATPQGHLRLVLVPIVYNALAGRADLRSTPLFRALHRAIRVSTYWPLVRPLPESVLVEADAAAGIPPGATVAPLFQGPKMLETTAMKYMFMFKDQGEMEASKRNRTTGASTVDNGLLTAAIVGSGTLAQPTDLVELLRKSSSAAGLAQQGSAVEGEERRATLAGAVAGTAAPSAPPPATLADGLAAVADAAAAAALGLTSPADALPRAPPLSTGITDAADAADADAAGEETDSPMATDAGPVEVPAPRLPTPAGPAPGTVDPGTADAVRQLVDLKFQEVVRELNRLKNGMVQLYQGVASMMTSQVPPVSGVPTPTLPGGPAAMGWGQGLSSMVGKQSNLGGTALASQELFNRMYPGGGDTSGGGVQKLVRSRMGPPEAPSGGMASAVPPIQQPVPSWPPLQDAVAAAGLLPTGSGPDSSLGQLAALLGNSQEGDVMVAALARSGDFFPPLASALLSNPGEGGKLLSAFSLRDIQDQSQSAPEIGNAAAAAVAAAVAATAPAAPAATAPGGRTATPLAAPAATVNPSATDGKLVAPEAIPPGIDHLNEGAGSGNGQPSPGERVGADAQATVAWAHTVGAALPLPAPGSQ